jgi:hypothetical protein
VCKDRGDRLRAVRGLRDHVDACGLEYEPEPAAHERLVVGDHHAERSAGVAWPLAEDAVFPDHQAAPGVADSGSGRTARTRQPPFGRGAAASSPP